MSDTIPGTAAPTLGTVTPAVTIAGLPNFAGLAAHIESETARLHESMKTVPAIDPTQIAADVTAFVNAVQGLLAVIAKVKALFGGGTTTKPG